MATNSTGALSSLELPKHFCNLSSNTTYGVHQLCAVHVLLLLNVLEGIFAFLASSLYDSPNFFVPLFLLALETGLGIGSLVLVFGMSGCIGSPSGRRFDVLISAALLEFLVALYEAYLSMRARVKRRTGMIVKLVSGVFAFVIALIPSVLFAVSKGAAAATGDGYESCRNFMFNIVAEGIMLTAAYLALLIVVWAGMKRIPHPKTVGIVAVVSALAIITATSVFVFLVNDRIIPIGSPTARNRNWLTMQVPAAIMPVLTTLANKVTVFQGLRPRTEHICYEQRHMPSIEHKYDTDSMAIPWNNSEKTIK